jgi:hypothetical protein
MPRQDASTEELKALAVAFTELTRRELGHAGILESFDPGHLADLIRGELPQPMALRIATEHGKLGEHLDLKRLFQDLGRESSDRSLHFALRDGPSYDRRGVIQVLRQVIPAELVEDILIGDESWDLD